jgi:hypothetical protein
VGKNGELIPLSENELKELEKKFKKILMDCLQEQHLLKPLSKEKEKHANTRKFKPIDFENFQDEHVGKKVKENNVNYQTTTFSIHKFSISEISVISEEIKKKRINETELNNMYEKNYTIVTTENKLFEKNRSIRNDFYSKLNELIVEINKNILNKIKLNHSIVIKNQASLS